MPRLPKKQKNRTAKSRKYPNNPPDLLRQLATLIP